MASFSIVEHLNVLKQIGPGFVSGPIGFAVDTLSLEDGEEALDDGKTWKPSDLELVD